MLEVVITNHSADHEAVLTHIYIENDQSGDDLIGSYDVSARLYDERKSPTWQIDRDCKVKNFPRCLGPEALVSVALQELGFEPSPRIIRELTKSSRELTNSS